MSKKNKHDNNNNGNVQDTDDMEAFGQIVPDDILPEDQSAETVETEPSESVSPVVEDKPIEIKKEEAPMPALTPVKPIAKVIATAEKAVSRPLSDPIIRLVNLTKAYIELVQPGIKLEENKKKAVELLTSIAQLVLSANSTDVFDAFYGFMMKNRSIMLSSQTIASNLVKYADKSKIVKITQFYVVFQSIVESKILKTRNTLNIATVRQLLGNDHLADWLLTKR